MTASQMRIAETIDAFYGDAGAKDGVSRSYKQAVEDLDAETIKALDGPYRATVLEPISRFCAYFPDVNECKWHPREDTCYMNPSDRLGQLVSNIAISRHQKTRAQTPRLRCAASESQETR